MNKNGDRATITFVVLDAGRVVDTQKQSVHTHGGELHINGKQINLGDCR